MKYKHTIRTHRWTIFYLLALVLILVLSVRGLLTASKAETGTEDALCPLVVIDPGHGGADGGAVGTVTGVREAALNLAISRKLHQILALCGVPSVLVRTDENALEAPEAETIAAKKVTDTKNRVALINSYSDAVLVSIHQNMFPEARYFGAQVFWAPTQGSQALAEQTQQVLRSTLNPDNHRMAKAAEGSLYLINHINCPGILVECGFLSNAAEEALLCREDYQTKAAAAIAGALLTFYASPGEEP